MSGFGLYETLRIFVPGVIASLVLDIVVRLSLGRQRGVAQVIRLVESPVGFAAVALIAGLLLYLVDFPTKTATYVAGAKNYPLPSRRLGELLSGADAAKKWGANPIGLYVMLSDRFMNPETHRRIYLFGSLYRIFVDFRLVLALGAMAGPSIGLIALPASRENLAFDLGAFAFVVAVLATVLWIGWLGEREHARKAVIRNLARPPETATPAQTAEAVATYKTKRRTALRPFFRLYAIQLCLGTLAVVLLVSPWHVSKSLGFLTALLTFSLWCWVEMGSRAAGPEAFDWRQKLFERLRITTEEDFSPIQRLGADICLFAPFLFGATVPIAYMDRPSYFVAFWAILMVPCTSIMAVRKHESRLIAVFRDQTLWLESHSGKIDELRRTGNLAELWQASGGDAKKSLG